ncbi:MAG: undecaprenyldiphospho-muramoylpentapeptide beta-N-acetylglucosaminyltransferase [candidate division WOR-3 bacterium]
MRLLLTAGGTGGHIFPGLALAGELQRLGVEVVWLGRKDGLEATLAEEEGIRFEPLGAAGFFGKGIGGKVMGAWLLGRGIVRSLVLFDRFEPDALVAAGGYVSAAPLVAAQLRKKPYFLLEQNCIPGRVTRFFAPKARESYLTFPTVKPFPGAAVVTGSPLRPALQEGRRNDDGRTVLVLGGSGGAQALSKAALDVAAALPNLNFIILTGRRDYQLMRSLVRSKNVELVEFTFHPEELYRRATIAISRAGGLVLSELLAFGIPVIVVPFPYATDQHQHANAQFLASIGAGVVLDQSCLSGLTTLVQTLLNDEPRRQRMAQAAKAAARPDAGRVIAERIVRCLAG